MTSQQAGDLKHSFELGFFGFTNIGDVEQCVLFPCLNPEPTYNFDLKDVESSLRSMVMSKDRAVETKPVAFSPLGPYIRTALNIRLYLGPKSAGSEAGFPEYAGRVFLALTKRGEYETSGTVSLDEIRKAYWKNG